MATSDKPVEEETLDATDEEWEEDEEDPTVSESIVPYQGGIVPRAQWDLRAVFQAFGGVALWCHDSTPEKPKPALHYKIPNRGEGLTARSMRILSAMRGGFEEIDCKVRQAEAFEPVIGPDGKVVVETVPAIEALVPIRDLLTGNVRVGVYIEPMAQKYKDSDKYYLKPNPRMSAISKAKRNAYGEHFAAIVEPLLIAIMGECNAKRQFFSGELPAWIAKALPTPDEDGEEPVPSAVDQKRARAEVAIGNVGRDEISDRLRPLVATFGEAIREEFVIWGTETFGTSKIAHWPARRKPEIDAWFAEKAEALGETLDAERVAGDEERPDPREGTPELGPEESVADFGLSGAVLRAKEIGLTDKQVLELKSAAGLLRGEATEEKVADFSARVRATKKSNGAATPTREEV